MGASITFEIGVGGGQLGGGTTATVPSGSDGIAEAPAWMLGPNPGTNTVVVTARGVADPLDDGPFSPNFDLPDELQEAVTVGDGELDITATGTGIDDGFESPSGWTGSGSWIRSTLTNSPTPIKNIAYPTYVTAASGDGSMGDLPAPFSGSYAFWFGEDASGHPTSVGNYMGQQIANDAANSGGESVAQNSGTLTSPVIELAPGLDADLMFDTWFEIESFDPDRFDFMRISVEDVGTGDVTVLGLLNPTVDPNGPPNVPYTSGGYDQPPVWFNVSQSLSAFSGKSIRLIFEFETVDVLYNGFRGWILDNVRVVTAPPIPAGSAMLVASPPAGGGLNPDRPAGSRN